MTMAKKAKNLGGSFPLQIYNITENINRRKIISSDTPAPRALKIDKISKNELAKNTGIIKRELDLTNNMAIIPFSSVTKIGKDQVLSEIAKVLED